MSDSDANGRAVRSSDASAEIDSTPSGFEAKQAADDLELLELTFHECAGWSVKHTGMRCATLPSPSTALSPREPRMGVAL